MTLRDCIALYEAHRPAQRVSAALTPLGAATATVSRLRRLLAALEPAERAAVLAPLRDELVEAAVAN